MRVDFYDIAVIGGGASGMIAALFAARALGASGATVALIERNEKLGKKLYITGKGRCNLTNAAEPDDFMRNILRNPRFLYSSLDRLSNLDLMALIESLGVPLKTERGERVFPQSDRASDINRALERELRRLGVSILLDTRVASLDRADEGFVIHLEGGSSIHAGRAILATGGLSYPLTGSTGDGHRMAAALGHQATDAFPALTGIDTIETWPAELMGLTLKNVALSAFRAGGNAGGKKKIYGEMGELLFTHFGISGPLALTLSSLLPMPDCRGVSLLIDLKPALDEQTLDQRILRDIREAPNKRLASVMDGLAPHSLAAQLLALAEGCSPALPVHSLTQEQRHAIVRLLKALPLTVKGVRGFDEAIITRGGVQVKGINPSTMESKTTPGLYFAGELIDVDALTGGFNLQIAFSTGALAGQSAANAWKDGATDGT